MPARPGTMIEIAGNRDQELDVPALRRAYQRPHLRFLIARIADHDLRQPLFQGGFGGILFRAHEWATREQTLRSYELFARYVMPQFQGSLETIVGSSVWARENRKQVFGSTVEAVRARLHRRRQLRRRR